MLFLIGVIVASIPTRIEYVAAKEEADGRDFDYSGQGLAIFTITLNVFLFIFWYLPWLFE